MDAVISGRFGARGESGTGNGGTVISTAETELCAVRVFADGEGEADFVALCAGRDEALDGLYL